MRFRRRTGTGKEMAKRIIALILCMILTTAMISCASTDGGGNDDTGRKEENGTSADPSETTIYYEPDNIPDGLNFGGEKVVILSQSIKNSGDHFELTAEELTSEPINDSMYNREIYVEERLGVEIENITPKENVSLNDEIMRQINSDEDTYSVYSAAGHVISGLVLDGYLSDLYLVDYLDLDKPWWSQKFSEEAEIEDSLYLMTGSLSLSLLRNLYAVYFNKSLAEDYKNTIPELDDLYGIVERGEWTFDRFVEIGGDIYEDINGNQEADEEDLYGINYLPFIAIDAIWSGFDLSVFEKDETGWFTINVNTEKLFASLEKIHNLLHNTKGSTSYGGFQYSFEDCPSMFASGRSLFLVDWLEIIERPELRNMTADYGILPYPKYDAAQKEYYSYSHDQYRVFAIPVTNQKPEVTGATLEAMASYAYRDTVPAYLDVALKGKYMSDAKSRKTIDTVVNGFKLDASWIYFGNLSYEYPATYRYMVMNKETSYSSHHQKLVKKVELNLKNSKEIFEKNNGKK